MTSEELKLLNGLLSQLKHIKGIQKDSEAENLIHKAAAEQPDALYLLVQKTLLQEQALEAARNRINDLQRQIGENSTSAGGFLGQNPWSQTPTPTRQNPATQSGWQGGNPMAPLQQTGGMSSFLGSAAATAAGIAGGAFLFQGIESLMGHHNHSGFGNDYMDNANYEPQQIENVTINEYYGDQGSPNITDVSDDDSFDQDFDSYDDDVNSVDV